MPSSPGDPKSQAAQMRNPLDLFFLGLLPKVLRGENVPRRPALKRSDLGRIRMRA